MVLVTWKRTDFLKHLGTKLWWREVFEYLSQFCSTVMENRGADVVRAGSFVPISDD